MPPRPSRKRRSEFIDSDSDEEDASNVRASGKKAATARPTPTPSASGRTLAKATGSSSTSSQGASARSATSTTTSRSPATAQLASTVSDADDSEDQGQAQAQTELGADAPCGHSLQVGLDKLPPEMLLEILGYLIDTSSEERKQRLADGDAPRLPSEDAFLISLMRIKVFAAQAKKQFWSEIELTEKRQWEKLRRWVKPRVSRFKAKTGPAEIPLDQSLITTLNIELKKPGEGFGGLDGSCFEQMRELVPRVKVAGSGDDTTKEVDGQQVVMFSEVRHLRIRMNEQIRLIKRLPDSDDSYIDCITRLVCPTPTQPSLLTHLSISNTVPEPFPHVLNLISRLPNLKSLVVDNVLAVPGYDRTTVNSFTVNLPHLTSFTLRNSPDIGFSQHTGFSFLLRPAAPPTAGTTSTTADNAAPRGLQKLCLRDARIDSDFLSQVLESNNHTLKHLELGSAELPSCLSRDGLAHLVSNGTYSLDTGFFFPVALLQELRRMGNDALAICRNLVTASLGGLLCVSPALLDTLVELQRDNGGTSRLETLSLVNAWPMRPLRPNNDPDAEAEVAAIEANPSGIAPGDVLRAVVEQGLKIKRLEVKGMGKEWDVENQVDAKKLKEACEERDIVFIQRE